MQTADLIVVGGGLAGLSTAWHLAEDRNVLLLEQGDGPAMEASAQNAGLIRRMDLEPAERALAARTFAWLHDPHPDWTRWPAGLCVHACGRQRRPQGQCCTWGAR